MFDLGIYTARVSNIQRPRTKPDIQRTHISKSPAYRLPHFSFQEYILTHIYFFIFYIVRLWLSTISSYFCFIQHLDYPR